MPHRIALIIIILALSAGCAGGAPGRVEEGYPPEEPRQPQRLEILDSSIADPLEWWRVNICNRIPVEIYSLEEQQQTAEAIIEATNAVREEYNLPPVEALPILNRVAQAHAWDQATRDYWSHRTPEGLSSRQRILAAGGGTVVVGGENSAIATPKTHTPGMIVQGFRTHVGHRELLLNPDVTHIGVGVCNYSSSEWVYYVQLLVSLEE
ncbi:CAP domain-containing protein [bacterium]|nr:CAP domain-containing protein [bacterium]